jgi:hypothetical protein
VAATTPSRTPLKLEDFPLSALFTQALRQFDDAYQLKAKVAGGDLEKWVCAELACDSLKRQACAALTLLGGEGARKFLKLVLDLKIVNSEAVRGGVWALAAEMGPRLAQLGFPEDEHYLLMQDIPALQKTIASGLSKEATVMHCRRVLASIENGIKRPRTLPTMSKSELVELSMMVRENGLLKDFPRITMDK